MFGNIKVHNVDFPVQEGKQQVRVEVCCDVRKLFTSHVASVDLLVITVCEILTPSFQAKAGPIVCVSMKSKIFRTAMQTSRFHAKAVPSYNTEEHVQQAIRSQPHSVHLHWT